MILCCPDKLRGSATAAEAAAALARGVASAGMEARELPLADGGEGTLDAVIAAGGAEVFEVLTVDALERPQQVRVAMLDGWIFSGNASAIREVWVGGRRLVEAGRHAQREAVADRFRAVVRRLAAGG